MVVSWRRGPESMAEAVQAREGEGLPSHSAPRKMLIFAYCCHPTYSMESRVGWYRSLHAAERFETYVLYGDKFQRSELERLASEHPFANRLHFIQVDHGAIGERLLTVPGCFYGAYSSWQKRAYQRALELKKTIPFDLVHQVNFCGYREPGYGWKLGIPFIWGPVGGTQNFPNRFLTATDFFGGLRELVRNAMNCIQFRASSRVRLAAKNAVAVFAANSTAQRDLKKVLGVDSNLQLEIGIQQIEETAKPKRNLDEPLKILWAGRLRTWKCLPLLLHALGRLPRDFRFQLRVLGQGSCLKKWQRLTVRLGIGDKIEWCGWPPYEQSLAHYRWADIFAFTSLRDTSGTGLLESLAAGTPIVGLNHQGLADIIRTDCGVPVQVTSPKDVAEQFRAIIMELAANPDRLEELGIGALKRAKDFHWDKLAAEMDRCYRDYDSMREGSDSLTPTSDSKKLSNLHEYSV